MIIEWLNNNGLAITAITTVLVLVANFIMAYVAYLQVLASRKQITESTSNRKIGIHNEQLKDLFRNWANNLYNAPWTGYEIFNCPIPDTLKTLLMTGPQFYLFSDVENHLPPKFKDLINRWKHYKDLFQKYVQKQKDITDKMKVFIFDIQKQKYPIDSIEPVYLKAIELTTNKKIYDYTTEQIQPGVEVLQFTKSADKWYPLGKGSEEELREIKEQFENISSMAKNKFEKDIRDLIIIQNEIKEIHKEILGSLNELIIYSEYCNMNCEYVFPK